MADQEKVSILLADEDALRRDGLSAVLNGAPGFDIVATCADGDSAMDRIRAVRPDVAVVDLNLPRVHGIELVRRVRGEGLATRVVIMSGSADDDIVREAVRAGADGYLVKNGPARHLVDAISYVRDGGQYFSPQLRRDGLDRHLLQEPPRAPAAQAAPAPPPPAPEPERTPEPRRARPEDRDRDDRDADRGSDRGSDRDVDRDRRPRERDDYDREYDRGDRDDRDFDDRDRRDYDTDRPSRAARSRYQSTPRGPRRRTADPQRFRERLREESRQDFGDHDYEILGHMAEGIQPLLDRLDEIEYRIGSMESGDAPVPSDVRGWLTGEIADTFQPRGAGSARLGRSVQEIEARLPQLIEEAVTTRFNQMAGKLQQEIEETHIRTLETFVKNIQTKLVARVVALETQMVEHAEAVQQLRDSSQRTEDNLGRLISGVDRLAAELPGRLAAAGAGVAGYLPPAEGEPVKKPRRPSKPLKFSITSPIVFWPVLIVFVLIVAGLVALSRDQRSKLKAETPATPVAPAPVAAAPAAVPAAAPGDTAAQLQAAQDAADAKDYQKAENLYRTIIALQPANLDALKGLASVLYREDKIEESAAILDKLPK